MIKLTDLLTEVVYIKRSEVPSRVLKWAEGVLGSRITKASVEQDRKPHISIPWHEGDRNYWQKFNLVGNDAKPVGDQYVISGRAPQEAPREDVEVPRGGLVAMVGIYPKRLEMYTGPGALKPISSGEVNISDMGLVALYVARALKSAYRPKFNKKIYDELIKGGYMQKNKSISLKGKNILQDQNVKDRLKKIIPTFNKKFPRHYISYSGF